MVYTFRKKNHEAKILLKISDHQQSKALAPSRGHPHTPQLLVVADSRLRVVDCRPSGLIRFIGHIPPAICPGRLQAASNW